MRRTHLRGHANILKRLLIHGSGFNLGLAMRHCLGIGALVHRPEGSDNRVPELNDVTSRSRRRPADHARSFGSECDTRSTLLRPAPSSGELEDQSR